MESSNKLNWDLVFKIMTTLIFVIAGVLIISSGVRIIASSGTTSIIPIIQFYLGLVSISISCLFLILLIILTRHPFYDFWLVCTVGIVVGILYAS